MLLRSLAKPALALGLFCAQCSAQTYQRLGGCPTLGCILRTGQADFLPGQFFDVRAEVHAPQNGSQRVSYQQPDPNFTFTVTRDGDDASPRSGADFFGIEPPAIENWDFTWYEDLFVEAAETPSLVNVAAKAWRRVAIHEPGNYIATVTYQDGQATVAYWTVRDIPPQRRAKNVISMWT